MSTSPLPGARAKAPAAMPLPFWIAEFALIRRAVLGFAACAALSVAGVAVSSHYQQQASARLLSQSQARTLAYTQFTQADNEKRDIRAFQPRFVLLRQRGLVGEENRLAWADAIHQVQQQRQLLPLSYEIAPQQEFRHDAAIDLGDYTLRASRMNLHMELLHEMDLFNLFDDLRRRNFFAVQECTLRRLSAAANAPGAPTLGADCTLNWITLTSAQKGTP